MESKTSMQIFADIYDCCINKDVDHRKESCLFAGKKLKKIKTDWIKKLDHEAFVKDLINKLKKIEFEYMKVNNNDLIADWQVQNADEKRHNKLAKLLKEIEGVSP